MMKRESGMVDSDRCRFCHGFFFKERPYVCVDCFERAAKIMESEGWQAPQIAQNNGWISTSEQEPPRGQPILLCDERGKVAFGWAWGNDGEIETDLPRGIEFEPIWRQLPPSPPPQEE